MGSSAAAGRSREKTRSFVRFWGQSWRAGLHNTWGQLTAAIRVGLRINLRVEQPLPPVSLSTEHNAV
ncbi:hypothetical protein INR49_018413 [Caranx melampygus]|nr:hypothetical protein INR49_018413 [Caranx melampygus]